MKRVCWLEDLARDIGLAVRLLRRSPGFAAAAIVSLALGIAATSAIFSVVNAVLLRPLDYRDPDRLVVVRHGGLAASAAVFLEWRARARTLERIGAAEYWSPNLAGSERTERIVALHVSSDILPLLGVEPAIGRMFTADEEHAGGDRVVVIGHRFWKNRLAADPAAIGRSLTLDGDQYTIVGVMPESFQFAPFWATKAELWVPLVLDARKADAGESLRVFARLAPGVSLSRARAELSEMTAAIERDAGRPAEALTVTPLLDIVVGDVKPALLVLLAASGLVLVIAGSNVAHLQLVRSAGRERELAVRTALGAPRLRVVRQLATEGFVLAAAGAVAGLALTYGTVRLLVALAPPTLPRIAHVSIDGRVVLFAVAATLVAGIIFGLTPAIHGTRFDVSDSLKTGGRGSADRSGRSVMRRLLIVSEFSMAMVLLAAAALIVRSFLGLLAVDSGFDPRGVSGIEVSVTGTGAAAPARRAAYFQQLVSRVRAVPGVQAASAINHLPLVGDIWRFTFAIEGREPVRSEERPSATYRVVLPGYFETMRIALVQGRDFTDADTLAAPSVVVINELMARRYWPNQSPVGRRLAIGNPDRPDWSTIVGVVRTVKQTTWSETQDGEMYFPYLQTRMYLESPRSFASYLSIVARSAPGLPPPFAAIDAAARALEPGAVIANPTTVEQAIAAEFVSPRFYMLLVGAFAFVAVALAAVGIYGVMSQAVATRTREIGVRLALGASGRQIVRLVMASGLGLAVAGSLVGVAGAFASARYLQTLLFGVEPTDPATLVAVALALIGVACAASYIPARRAIAVDPMTAVRSE